MKNVNFQMYLNEFCFFSDYASLYTLFSIYLFIISFTPNLKANKSTYSWDTRPRENAATLNKIDIIKGQQQYTATIRTALQRATEDEFTNML